MPISQTDGPGTMWRWTNEGDRDISIHYASLTSRTVVLVTVFLDGELVDAVYAGAGSSHSWWLGSGGGLVPGGVIKPKQTVEVRVDGAAAFRVDVGS